MKRVIEQLGNCVIFQLLDYPITNSLNIKFGMVQFNEMHLYQ